MSTSPAPKACLKCGRGDQIEIQSFRTPYAPPWVFLSILFVGPIGCFIAYRCLRRIHVADAYFCAPCWTKAKLANYVWPAIALTTTAFLVIGLYFSAAYKNDDVIGYLFFVSIGLVITGFIAKRILRPTVWFSNADVVRVDVPGHGTVDLAQPNSVGLQGLGLK